MGQSPKGETYRRLGDGVPLLNGPAEFGPRNPTPVQSTNSPTRLCQPGDVLFCVRGNTTGRINIADSIYCIGRGLAAIRGDGRQTDTAFLFHALAHLKPAIYGIALAGGSTFPNISKANLETLELSLPPLEEQREIARILSAVQRAIERQERLIALTAEFKKALMHKLFTEGTRGEPLKQTKIGPVPRSWTVGRLDTFCILQRGFDITKNEQTDGIVPVVSSGGIKSYHNVAKVKGPGVIVGRKGTLGTVHYVEGPYWPHDTTLWVKDFRGNHPRFTSYFLDSLNFARFDSGASNPTLNRNTVHGETVAYPPPDQQIEIAGILATAEAKHDVHERIARSLRSLFRTVLHQLMTAQIRVHDLDLSALDEAVPERTEVA